MRLWRFTTEFLIAQIEAMQERFPEDWGMLEPEEGESLLCELRSAAYSDAVVRVIEEGNDIFEEHEYGCEDTCYGGDIPFEVASMEWARHWTIAVAYGDLRGS